MINHWSLYSSSISYGCESNVFSPPARWGLLDFMSVPPPASSCLLPPPASSCLLLLLLVVLLVLLLNCDPRSTVVSVGPQPRPSTPSVPCRTSATTFHAQCSLSDLKHDNPRPVYLNHDHPRQCALPDLNHDHPRPVFPAGPQPRPSTPSVPCRTSTSSIHAKCSLPDLNLGPAQLSVHRWTSTARSNARRYAR